jgi:hypothetical protein
MESLADEASGEAEAGLLLPDGVTCEGCKASKVSESESIRRVIIVDPSSRLQVGCNLRDGQKALVTRDAPGTLPAAHHSHMFATGEM